MDRRFDNMEMDSTFEYNPGQRDASDPEIELCVHACEIDAGQLLAGSTDTEAVGLQTDADARQAADPNVGHWPVGFSPWGDPAATLSSAAAEASAAWHGQTTHSTPYPTTDAYYGPHPSVSGAAGVGQSSTMGSDLGCFVGQSLGCIYPYDHGCPHKHNFHPHFHVCDMFNRRWTCTGCIHERPTPDGADVCLSRTSGFHATAH